MEIKEKQQEAIWKKTKDTSTLDLWDRCEYISTGKNVLEMTMGTVSALREL